MARPTPLSLLAAAVLVAAVLLATGATGSGPPPVSAPAGPLPNLPSITAIGVGDARVAPAARNDRAITRVVAAAHARAIPRAFASARAEALRQARAAGVRLGAVQQVAPVPVSAYGYWTGAPNIGVRGIGRWCGWSRSYRRGDRGPRRYRCTRPHQESAMLSVTWDLRR